MSRKKLESLLNVLVGLNLVEKAEIDPCLAEMDPTRQTAAELLKILQAKHLLTPYQFEHLSAGRTDDLIIGGYKLLYQNASGSFARVYRACSIATGEVVALKLLRDRWSHDSDMVTQFKREAVTVKRLKHRNIVPIYDIGQQGDRHYFTMEFIEGGNLREFLDIRKKLSPVEATQYTLDIAQGLEYALTQGVTHRDLKLSNVLMSTQRVAKLIDFGLGGDDGISGYGQGDDQQRALEYATLEKGTGAPTNDPRSDLFFLGTIYYEMVSGCPPYPRGRDREARKQLSHYQNIRPLRQADPSLDSRIEDVVSRLITLSPADRYQTPSEVVSALWDVLRHLDENTDTDIPALKNAPGKIANNSGEPTVLCVENRDKQQAILRKHLGKEGFRVLLVGDPNRAVNRVRTSPPDAVLFMAPAFGEQTVAAYRAAVERGRDNPVGIVLILGKDQASLDDDLPTVPYAKALVQPVDLPTLRDALGEVIEGAKGYHTRA